MTDRYAVIGNPISHSKSPLIHSLFAGQTGQDISYEAIEAAPDGFVATAERLRRKGYKGCNVTVPFKFDAAAYATQLTERAKAAKSVNTLSFEELVIQGDNTDGAGLLCDLEKNLGISLKAKHVLLMGAGGAAYGVVLPLLNAGAALTVANRTAERAIELAYDFPRKGISAGSYAKLADLQFDLIINATSAGLTDSEIPLPAGIFAPGALAYELMYGCETPFMAFARRHGAQVADGLGMLVEQAAEAFYIWRGIKPETTQVIAQLRR